MRKKKVNLETQRSASLRRPNFGVIYLCVNKEWLILDSSHHRQQGCPSTAADWHEGWRCWGRWDTSACCGNLYCCTTPKNKRFVSLSVFGILWNCWLPLTAEDSLPEQTCELLFFEPSEVFFPQKMLELTSECFQPLCRRICECTKHWQWRTSWSGNVPGAQRG